jgi:tRNA-binding EMAP/Myf-like protein
MERANAVVNCKRKIKTVKFKSFVSIGMKISYIKDSSALFQKYSF